MASTAIDDERALQAEIERIGRTLVPPRRRAIRGAASVVDRLAAQDAELRTAMFRLVDVTPACRNLDDLGRHLASLVGELPETSAPRRVVRSLTGSRAGRVALGAAVAAGVRASAHRFIAGATPAAAVGELAALWERGIAATVDLLGEATVSPAEADAYAARSAAALDELAAASALWPERPLLEVDSAGRVPRANLSVKVSSLTAMIRPQAPERGLADAATRLRPLLTRARDRGAHLHVDMESLDALETTLELVLAVLDEPDFREGPSAGLVVQAYLRDSPAIVERVLAWAARTSRRPPLTVRLVKGAYWDHEVAEAGQHGWAAPVFTDKATSDRTFEALTRRLLDARPLVRVAIASHNLRSIAHAVAWNERTGGRAEDLELQVLRGLGDELAQSLARQGLRVRVYSPVGDLVAGMAYLVRRLLENTSNESFLVAQAAGVPIEQLLTPP
jgi:RHH-type proline utilization regulon transcriptional repressor/proline dehydrogenase/delta 1-pyrroline-5-carboxylate dehydrogenase